MRKKYLLLTVVMCSIFSVEAQILTTLADGGNKKAAVTERIGITDVSIHYDRPAVKGREGKIWGGLVHKGFADLEFGTSKASPWRAGANENTTIAFSTEVKVEGKTLPAGVYGLFMAMGDGEATVIFSKTSVAWGSYFYDERDDALRVTVKTVPMAESKERLAYEFMEQKENSAVVALLWEKLKIPFRIEVDYISTQLASYRSELKTDKGFMPEAWVEAINFCLRRNVNLEEALVWSDYALNTGMIGQRNFKTLSAKANVLKALGREAEAIPLMKEALPMAGMMDLHNYAKGLIAAKKPKEALEAFLLNAQKNPGTLTPNIGLMRGYSANGDFKNALKYAKAALALAPDKGNKDAIENYIKMLGEGKDVN
jgi:Protein of unknown function (DUF2911)